VLLQMASEGAVLRASRLYMKHFLESLQEKQRQLSKETQACQSNPNSEHRSQQLKMS
jgi:hypothetical protein